MRVALLIKTINRTDIYIHVYIEKRYIGSESDALSLSVRAQPDELARKAFLGSLTLAHEQRRRS